MDLFEITSFAEIIKSIKFSNESNFSENSHIIYQCFYDLLNKIDFQNMNTCIFGETDGFILTTITQRAKSVVVFPLESSSLIFTNLSQFKTLHNLKKFNLFARDINEKNEKAYQQICYIKKKPILFNECAILIISRNDQDYDKILKNIGKTILFEGVLIILSLEGKSETIVNKIKEETFLQSVQKYTLCPSSSVSVDIIIMSIKKSESPMQIPDDINILYENFKNSNQKKESSSQHTENNFLLSKYLSEIKMTKSDQNKAPKKYYIINGYFIYFFKDTKNKFNQPLKETDAQSYLFIPLYKYELTKSKKSIKVSQKESIINNLTIKQYKSLYENNDNDLFDTDCIYEFTPTDSNLFYELNTRSRAFLEETAKISSFSDLNFDAQLYTLPDYKTIKDPIDIPVSVRITSDGIFIYSSSPFYHVVFADYWDMNSYATPFPYVKCNMKSKDYRKTIALILTKGSRQSVQDDNDNNSEEIEIENELDFLFNCEKPEQQDTNEESNDDDNDNDDENEAQIEKEEQQNKKDKGKEKDKKDKGKDKDKGKGKVKDKQKDKEKDKEKEKDKGKDKDKDKGKDKDKDKGKDKNDQPKEKPEKSTEKDKNDQKKVKNEKPTNTDQDVDVNTKIKQFFQFNKQDNQNTICDKTLGCVSLKFANSKMMMNFVISVNQAISYSLSVSIKKRIEEMIIKMNNEKKSDEPKKKEGGNNDDDTNTIDY